MEGGLPTKSVTFFKSHTGEVSPTDIVVALGLYERLLDLHGALEQDNVRPQAFKLLKRKREALEYQQQELLEMGQPSQGNSTVSSSPQPNERLPEENMLCCPFTQFIPFLLVNVHWT